MKLRFLFCVAFLFLTLSHALSQKKEIIAAQDLIKQGTNLEGAESSMRTLLNDSANRKNSRIWITLFDAMKGQYEQGNEKLYLKQDYDTAAWFNVASRLFKDMECYDSIDALPDKNGRKRPALRKQNSNYLNLLRPNLFNGGVFYTKRKAYDTAYYFFNQYVDAAYQPLFWKYHYNENDSHMPAASYWAAYCGYKLGDVDKVLHHAYLALKDTAHNEQMLQYLAATYRLENDTARFVAVLEEGFNKFPLSAYFFPHLISYLSERRNWDRALNVANTALKADSTNPLFLLTKSTILVNKGEWQEAFDICDTLIKRGADKDSTLADALLNAGLAKYNQGVTLEKDTKTLKRKRNETLQYYREALPFLERYRQLRPEANERWGLPLYTIYLNLNMGKDFDEVDRLLRQK